MNQTFNFVRWRKLVVKHWSENSRRYGLTLLAIGGLQIAWYSLFLALEYYDPLELTIQFSTYFVGLYLIGCLYASSLFSDLGSRTTGISYLSLPASHLEKLLCALFYSVLLFFIAFTLVFYIVDIPMVQIANRIIEHYPRTYINTNLPIPAKDIYNVFKANGAPIPERDYHLFLLGFFAVQSAFTLGSVWFTRYSFIKTVVTLLLFVLAATIVLIQVKKLLPPDWHSSFFEWNQQDSLVGVIKYIRLPSWIRMPLFFVGLYGLPFIFWTITYFRLKEKEV